MAVAQMRVPTIFTAVDRFSDVVSKMTSKTSHFSKSTVGAINRVDHRLNNMWGSMNNISQLAIGGGVGGLFYYAGKDIMDYETAIHSLGAVTGTVVGVMNKDIESLGKETGRSVIDITKGFEDIGSKMSEYLKNPTALKEIARQGILMANASRMSAEDSIDNLTSLLNQFGKGYGDANAIVNKLSAGEDIGASTIPETIDILRQFAASARMAGADYTESIAMVQAVTKTLGKQGVGRNFRNIMVDLNTGKGMDKNKLKALAMVGINIDKMIDPATTFIEKMKELTKLSANKQAMGMFFKKTGMEAGSTFLREFKTFEKYLDFIKNNNTAQAKAAKNTATFSFAIDQLKNKFTNFIVTNNDANGALGVTKSLIRWMTDNMGTLIKVLVSVLAVFLAWKAIVGVIALINGVMATFNAIMAVHRFIVLWATMTNVGYAASLWAVAAATLAAYWPLLLIAGALGVLVYSLWDTKSATDAMVGSQISGLDKSNMAWKNSTSVMAGELSKQNNLLAKTNIGGKALAKTKVDVSTIDTIYNKLKAAELQNAKLPKSQQLSKNALKYQVQTGFYSFEDKKYAQYNPQETPQNLAGRKDMQTTEDLMNKKTGKLELYIKTDKGVEASVISVPSGIEVKTTPNQGKR